MLGKQKNTCLLFCLLAILSKTVLAQFMPPTGTGGCPKDYIATSMFGIPGCVFVSQDKTQNVSWGIGQRICKQMDPRANLPFFADSSQMNSFKSATGMLAMQVGKVTVWLGGFINRTDENWYFLDGTTRMAMNGSGSSWNKDTPNKTAPSPQRCLGFAIGGSDTGWRDFPCASNFSVGCFIGDPAWKVNDSVNLKLNATGLQTPAIACPSGWYPNGGFCYKIATPDRQNFAAGDSACKALDPRATLPHFYYPSDWEAFIKYVESNRPLTDHQIILLGGRRNSSIWTNSDGTWNFTNWFPTQPGIDDCIFTCDILGYGWNTTSCSSMGYTICQLNTSMPFPTTTTITPTTTVTPTTGSTIFYNCTSESNDTYCNSTSTSTVSTSTTTTLAPVTTTTVPTQLTTIVTVASVASTASAAPADTNSQPTAASQSSAKGSTSVITPYSWEWKPPIWFLIILGLLVLFPVIFWIIAICYREIRDRGNKKPSHPQTSQEKPILVEGQSVPYQMQQSQPYQHPQPFPQSIIQTQPFPQQKPIFTETTVHSVHY